MTAEQLEAIGDMGTHRQAWREAIAEMKRLADDGSDAGDMHYWQHELNAFDRTFALAPALARRVIAAEKLVDALEFIAETESWQANHATDALTAYREASK